MLARTVGSFKTELIVCGKTIWCLSTSKETLSELTLLVSVRGDDEVKAGLPGRLESPTVDTDLGIGPVPGGSCLLVLPFWVGVRVLIF